MPTSSSVHFNGFIRIKIFRAQALVWLRYNVLCGDMAAAYGPREKSMKEQHFISPSRGKRSWHMREGSEKILLLVEDNMDDVELAMRSFQRHHIVNRVMVVNDGAEALDYLFCKGRYADREPVNPVVILLDLKLPKIDGIEVLRQL